MKSFKYFSTISVLLLSHPIYADIIGFRHSSHNSEKSAEFITNDTVRGGSGIQANITKDGKVGFSNGTFGAAVAYIHDSKGNVVKKIIIPPANQDKFKSIYNAAKNLYANTSSLVSGKTAYSDIQWYDSPDFKISTDIDIKDFPKGGAISYAHGTNETLVATAITIPLKIFTTASTALIKTNDQSKLQNFLFQEILSEAMQDTNLIAEVSFLIQHRRTKEIFSTMTNWLKLNTQNILITAARRYTADYNLQQNVIDKLFDITKSLEITSDALTIADQAIEIYTQNHRGPTLLYFDLPYEGEYFDSDFYFNWNGTELAKLRPMKWTSKKNHHDAEYEKLRWYNPLTWGKISDGFKAEYARWSYESHPSLSIKSNNNSHMLNNGRQKLISQTSHFSTTTIPQYNVHNRKTVQENPYLAKGSAIIEAPADIVLNWGNRPADLDSHLTGPINAQSSERFHVNYQNKGSLNSNPNVLLYRDDTSHGAGSRNRPEQTRINVTQPGVYNFYVHDFSNKGSPSSRALSNSGAVVSVHTAGNRNLPEGDNLGRKVTQFTVPKDKIGTVWHTFELDTRRNTIKPVNTFHNDTKVIK